MGLSLQELHYEASLSVPSLDAASLLEGMVAIAAEGYIHILYTLITYVVYSFDLHIINYSTSLPLYNNSHMNYLYYTQNILCSFVCNISIKEIKCFWGRMTHSLTCLFSHSHTTTRSPCFPEAMSNMVVASTANFKLFQTLISKLPFLTTERQIYIFFIIS